MIEPPPARRIAGMTCFTERKTPSRLIVCWRRQSARDICSRGTIKPMPALATITSMRPKLFSAAAMTCGQRASSVTSWSRNSALPPAADILPTTLSPPDRSMSVMTTLAPARASVSAHAAPIPEAPPVTIATLPFICMLLPPTSDQFSVASGLQRPLPELEHVSAEQIRLVATRADQCAFAAIPGLERVDHQVSIDECGIGIALERMDEGAVVGEIAGRCRRRNRGLLDALQGRAAIEAVRG